MAIGFPRKRAIVIQSVVAGVVLNIVLSLVVSQFATPEQIAPPNGAAALSYPDQFVHMLVHHRQVLLMSSLIVAIVVAASVSIGLVKMPFMS